MAATKQSLAAAIKILEASNWRSKRVRNAVSLLRRQLRTAPFDAIDWNNFHDATSAMFYTCSAPAREPDFISNSGSMYWKTPDGVIRMSDHWGFGIRSCNWYLTGIGPDFSPCFERGFYAAGYCKFADFKNGLAWPIDFKEAA